MSIAPSTDIVAEVARAADPARAAAVTAKLNALSNQGAGSPEDFAAALDSAGGAAAAEGLSDARGKLVNATLRGNTRADKAHTKLESLVLGELIGEMLPKNTPSAYGQGFAGDMWRSMLAELLSRIDQNQKILHARLRAARTIAEVLARAIRDGQSDGTYSAQIWRENRR